MTLEEVSDVSQAAVGERRTGPRQPMTLPANLVSLDGAHVLGCRTRNLSEGGMFVSAPIGFGVAVGQRYELLLSDNEFSDSARDLMGEGHYVTVVRTQVELDGANDRVGVGLRFDQSIVL